VNLQSSLLSIGEFIIESMAAGVIDPDVIDEQGFHFVTVLHYWGILSELLDKYLNTKPCIFTMWVRILTTGIWKTPMLGGTMMTSLCNAEPLWRDLSIVQRALQSASPCSGIWTLVMAELLRRWHLSLRRLWIQAVVV
jgi:hypothetical protein